jgi:LysR family transcriptional activator of mexEF-oprN operon
MGIKLIDGMDTIDYAHLRKLDLNLMLALDALVSERNVTRAAARLGLGQPAVSHALARLREVLGDEILIRSGSAMTLTARAIQLASPLREALHQLQRLATPPHAFVPATSQVVFRIAMSPHDEAVLFPTVLRRLAGIAPGVRVISSHLARAEMLTALDNEELDAGIGVLSPNRSWHRAQPLFSMGFALIFDRKFGDATKLDNYLERPHALLTTQADLTGRVDKALARIGKSRRVIFSTPNFLSLEHILPGTPIVACVPEQLARRFEASGLSRGKPPAPIAPFTVSLAWHGRLDADPAHTWFRAVIGEAASNLKRRSDEKI